MPEQGNNLIQGHNNKCAVRHPTHLPALGLLLVRHKDQL